MRANAIRTSDCLKLYVTLRAWTTAAGGPFMGVPANPCRPDKPGHPIVVSPANGNTFFPEDQRVRYAGFIRW